MPPEQHCGSDVRHHLPHTWSDANNERRRCPGEQPPASCDHPCRRTVPHQPCGWWAGEDGGGPWLHCPGKQEAPEPEPQVPADLLSPDDRHSLRSLRRSTEAKATILENEAQRLRQQAAVLRTVLGMVQE